MPDSSFPPLRGDSAGAREGHLIEPGRLFRLWREHWVGAAAAALLVALLAGVALLRQKPVYAASATLLVERSNDRVLDIKQVVDDTVESSLTDALMLTHIQQLQSHSFLVQVIASLTPAQRLRFLAPYPPSRPQPTALVADGSEVQTERLAKLLTQGLKVERSGRTLLITLTVRHRDPAMAELIANDLAEQYIIYLINRSSLSNDSALIFLNSQATNLRSRLERAEHELQDYRERNNLVLLDHDQTILSDRLKLTSAAATQARMTRLALDARLSQVKGILQASPDGVRQLAGSPEFTALTDVQRQIDDLEARRSILADRYGPMHPLMLVNAGSLRAFERLRTQQINGALSELGAQRDQAAADEQRIQDELAAAQKESLRLDHLTVRDEELKREVQSVRDSYSQILSRLNETTISSRLQSTNIKFVDRARLPEVPVEPNPLQALGLAAALGAIAFAAFPWAADAWDQRIHSWSEIEGYLDARLLAELPAVPNVPASDRSWIVARDLDDPSTDAFRSLHGQLQLVSRHPRRKTILVTSTIPGEGKSFVAANLAASFAAHGRRTLLVDADFRRPSLHQAFGLDNAAGILTWDRLGGEGDAGSIAENPTLGVIEVAPNLFLLRSGGVSRRLTELLEGGALGPLLTALRQQFDVVLVDAPPAGVFPDAEVLGRLADEVVYICRFKGPPREHVRQVLGRLRKDGLDLPGVVLNAIPVGWGRPNYFSAQGYSAIRHAKYYAQKA